MPLRREQDLLLNRPKIWIIFQMQRYLILCFGAILANSVPCAIIANAI